MSDWFLRVRHARLFFVATSASRNISLTPDMFSLKFLLVGYLLIADITESREAFKLCLFIMYFDNALMLMRFFCRFFCKEGSCEIMFHTPCVIFVITPENLSKFIKFI